MADKETTEDRDDSDETPDAATREEADSKETPDEETDHEEGSEEEEKKVEPARTAPLPSKVERALAAAREAAKADHERKSGRWLVVIPVSIAAVLLSFLLPRSTPPDGIPLPRVDHRVTSAIARAEERLADAAEQSRLPGDVLMVGTTIRELNIAENEGNDTESFVARTKLDNQVALVMGRPDGEQDLIKLRASQARTFLRALETWEKGEAPQDFAATAESFVSRAQDAGWTQGRHILLDAAQRRVAFKAVWNAITHLDAGNFVLTLDEERTLYAFYITHPRVPEGHRLVLESKRREATSPEACATARTDWRREQESWRAEKIRRLATIDPTYPASYALGISYFNGGRVDLAVESFNAYLEKHPEGAYALRARNHLKAALTGSAP